MDRIYFSFALIAAMTLIEGTHSLQEMKFGEHQRQCSRSESQMKVMKNQQEMQQRMMMCRQGYQEACEKAQKDQQSIQKHMYLMQNCPYP